MSNNNSMTPVNVGAIYEIPKGNLNPNQAGSYANLKKELDDAKKRMFTTGSSAYPGFTPGFSIQGLGGCWQCMSNPK